LLAQLRSLLTRDSGLLPRRRDELDALAVRARDGDPGAIRTLLVILGPHLLRVVRRVLGPTHPEVEDAVQEAAFAIPDALARYRGDCSLVHFACKVAVNTATNVRRRESAAKRNTPGERVSPEELAAGDPSPDTVVQARACATLVRELLDSLPAAQAEALALHAMLGFTVAEVAEATDVPAETVRSRLRLGKRALRDQIEGNPRLVVLKEEAG